MQHRFYAALFLVLLAGTSFAGCAKAPEINLDAELESLVQAELAFAQAAADLGMNDAFLEYLAEESVVFRPNPVDGREWFRARPPTDALLSWYPSHADISQDGKLGYTTGPYEYRAMGPLDPVVRHGNYVSLWRKQADGLWKVILDMGASNPAPETAQPAWQPPPAPLTPAAAFGQVSGMDEVQAITEADRAASSADAPADYFAEGARLLRQGAPLRVGRASVLGALPEGRAGWHPLRAEVSAAGDLGYTFGRYEAGTSYYLRIWRREPDRPWLIVLELSAP